MLHQGLNSCKKMARRAQIDYQAVLENALANYPSGIALDELMREAKLSVDRSTVSRHLAQLIALRRVERVGNARAARYRLLGVGRIRAYLAVPYARRAPARYRREFLDRYLPGKTGFLSPAELEQLYAAGRVNIGNAPAGTYARRIYERFMIDLSYASSKLEGNTYNLLDTERLVRYGKELEGKDRKEAVMILNHKEAVRFIVDNLPAISLARKSLLDVHALLSDGLLADPAHSGRLRRSPVKIGGSAYTPLDDPYQIEEEFQVLAAKLAEISEPFEQAFCLLVFIPYLQAFEDVNKRTSRVGANIPLLKHDLCPLSFITVDERDYVDGTLGVYELNDVALLKQAFIEGYIRSAANYRDVRAELETVSVGALEYRKVVKATVRAVVRDWRQCEDAQLRAHLAPLVKPEHLNEVIANVKQEVSSLHEGNLIRFGLTHADLHNFRGSGSLSDLGSIHRNG